jgi:hypothetical protein
MSLIVKVVTVHELAIQCDVCGTVVHSTQNPHYLVEYPSQDELRRREYGVRLSMTMARCDLCKKHYCERHFMETESGEDCGLCPDCTKTHYIVEHDGCVGIKNRKTRKHVKW